MRARPWLFEEYPELEGRIPWASLGDFPTPVHRLEGLCGSEEFCEIWVKRDDRSSSHYGGNKVRKLEFTLADAKRRGKRYVLTFGGLGSNHCLATTIHSRRLGLRSILVLHPQPITPHVRRNLLLDVKFGAEVHLARNSLERALIVAWIKLTRRGVYTLPLGGSSPLGALGFVDAGLELARQVESGEMPEPREIYLALGTGGTLAGLLVGLRLAGLNSRLIGVRVTPERIGNAKKVEDLANRVVRLLRSQSDSVPDLRFGPSDLEVIHDFYGPGYGAPTREAIEVRELLLRTDGVELDLTYTAKAFAALLARARAGARGPLLFWDTFNSVDLTPHLEGVGEEDLPPRVREFLEREGEPSL